VAAVQQSLSEKSMGNEMPTFMTPDTFNSLKTVQEQLAAALGTIGPSYIFLPWAGEQLIAKGRGLYYVGIATAADAAGTNEQEFGAALRGTENFCRRPTYGQTPFWLFLDALTRELLSGAYDRTQDRWGWSNLLKIAGTIGTPHSWPPALIDGQREVCVAAFREEIAKLRNSLIVVTSARDYGIIYEVAGPNHLWDTKPRESQLFFRQDVASGNMFVHTYHANYMRQRGIFDKAVADTVRLAREMLPEF
jgi:hypothetical protein